MAVVWTDLMVPTGELEPGWFPDDTDDGEDRVTGYIAVAETKGTTDAAVTAYAYHLAYRAIWAAMGAGGSTAAITGEESVGWSAADKATFKTLSDEKLAEFLDEIAEAEDDPFGGFSVLTSLRHG